MADTSKKKLVKQLVDTKPGRALRRYVAEHGGDVEGYLWDQAMGETKATVKKPVRRAFRQYYSPNRDREDKKGSQQPAKVASLAPFFSKVANLLVKAPALKLKPMPTPKTFQSAATARTTGRFRGQVNASNFKPPHSDVVNYNRSISDAMKAGSPRAPK